MRRSYRRATGNNSVCKKLQSIIADTPLVKNLDNTEYMDAILDGKESLKILFGEMADILLNGSRISSDRIKKAGYEFRFADFKDAVTNR